MIAAMKLPPDGSYFEEFDREARRRGFDPVVLSETADGPLEVWERAGAGPVVYVSSGIHGDEPAGPLAMLEWMRSGGFGGDFHWRLAPVLNPAGVTKGTRGNAAGLDLNRDYLLRTSREVAAHAAWLEAGPLPELFVSLHEDWESAGFYLYEINLLEDCPARTRSILGAVRPWLEIEAGPEIDGHEAREAGWIYHAAEADVPEGWPEAILMAKLGCPLSYTFETPSGVELSRRVAAQIAALRVAIRFQG